MMDGDIKFTLPIPNRSDFLSQDGREFVPLLQLMKGSRSILEIGSRYGASLFNFVANMPDGSRVVSVDLGRCPDVKDHETGIWWKDICAHIANWHDMHIIQGDSHSKEVIEQVTALGPYDFIFIDGDHSSEGVRADWENYGPLGKYVGFHDICLPNVFPLWCEIKQTRRTVEFAHVYGIGVVLP